MSCRELLHIVAVVGAAAVIIARDYLKDDEIDFTVHAASNEDVGR
jgi:hypothetical protein